MFVHEGVLLSTNLNILHKLEHIACDLDLNYLEKSTTKKIVHMNFQMGEVAEEIWFIFSGVGVGWFGLYRFVN